MLAQNASGVYFAENCPIVECPLLLSDREAITGASGITVVGLTKVRPLTRVPPVGNGDGRLDSPAGIVFASIGEIGIEAAGIGRPTDGVLAGYAHHT